MEEVKEFVAFVLKKNGFRVIKDFRCPLGWIDVAGFKRGFSVGVEIGNPKNVARKLLSYPFSLRIVLCDGCDFESDEVTVTDLRGMCEILGIECDFEAWLESRENSDYELYRKAMELLREKLSDNAVVRRAIDALIYLYMAGEVIEDYSGKVKERVPFVRLFPTLVECGLAIRDTKEFVRPKTFMTSLTREGFRVAKVVLKEKLRKADEILKDFREEILFVIVTGLAERRGLVLKDLNIEEIEVSGGKLDEIYYSILPLFAKLDLYEILKMLRGLDPLVALCRLLSYTVFYGEAKNLFERLFEVCLASKVPVYDYYGEFFGYEYRTSKEVAEFLSKRAYAEIDEKIVLKFRNIIDLAFMNNSKTKDLEVALERGIVRVKGNGIEVVDEERFEEFVKARMAKITAEAVESIFSSRAP